jgi:hypothetical protein
MALRQILQKCSCLPQLVQVVDKGDQFILIIIIKMKYDTNTILLKN